MTARDDYPYWMDRDRWNRMCDEVDRLRKVEDAIADLIVKALITGEPIRIDA